MEFPDTRVLEDSNVLSEMMNEVYAWCIDKGWEPDNKRTFGDECALLTSEISEALEAFRVKGTDRYVEDPATFPYSELVTIPDGISYPTFVQNKGLDSQREIMIKPEGVPSEFADLLIRLLHYCKKHEIDLFAEYRAKMDYNYSRAYRHGNKAL